MIWHTALFRWTDEATAEQKQLVERLLAQLPALVPSLREFRFGSDVGANDGNFDFGVAASFDDLAGYLAYRDNPDHRAMIEDHILPIAASRAAVQFEA
jgi:hypothetical protein